MALSLVEKHNKQSTKGCGTSSKIFHHSLQIPMGDSEVNLCVSIKIQVKSNVVPWTQVPRRIPLHYREPAKAELEKMISEVLVAQLKRMTTKLRLLSRFNAASLATNLTTTTMYNTISNGIILNLVRSLHDQVARVNNYHSKSTT